MYVMYFFEILTGQCKVLELVNLSIEYSPSASTLCTL